MAKAETKVPVTTEENPATPAAAAMQAWRPFESLRREVDRLFEDFTLNPFRLPLRRPRSTLSRSGSRIPGSPCRRWTSSSGTRPSR